MTNTKLQRLWRRELRAYLVLAGSYFGLFAVLLTLIPSLATRHGSGPAAAGVLLAILAAAGLIGDSLVGRAGSHFGTRPLIFTGIGVTAAGSTILLSFTSYTAFVIASALLGFALSMMLTPILGGLSSHAGEKQISAQATNAAWQRAGALIAALFLMNLLGSSGELLIIVAIIALLVSLLGGALVLTPRAKQTSDAAARPQRRRRGVIVPLVRSSRTLRAGLVITAGTPLLIIVGSSFFPLVLITIAKPELLVLGLVAREAVAIIAALSIRTLTSRRTLGVTWAIAATVGALGLLAIPFVESNAAIIIFFSLHGAAITTGVTLGNVRLYDGSTPETRLYGFAASSMLTRLAGLLYPLMLGSLLSISAVAAFGSVAVVTLVIGITYALLTRDEADASDTEPAAPEESRS
ncbi:MFS transporter [Rhodoglobus sp. NPDC076762]